MIAYPSKRNQIVPVTAFVDWNCQIYAAKPLRGLDEGGIAAATLQYVGNIVARCLARILPDSQFDVTLRVYHGWHRGFQVTPRRKALIAAAAGAGPLSTKTNVLVRPDIEFGDSLLSAAQTRFHSRLGCHLPNTLRKSINAPDTDEEKMVDTAIASDVVDLAHRDPSRWLVVLGEDDDLAPPVLAADGIRAGQGGRVLLMRSKRGTPFLLLDNIEVQK